MPNLVIDILGDRDEEETKKALLVKEEPKTEPERERLQRQVININGEIVTI